jgi:hypothetical protein
MRGRLVQKRLQEHGVTGIIGQADKRKAKFIQLKKESPPEMDSRALFKEKLRKINARMVQLERIMARKDAHRKKLEDKIRRKSDKRNRRLLRREIVLTEKIKEEAGRIFAAKPYDPHKKERSRVKYK